VIERKISSEWQKLLADKVDPIKGMLLIKNRLEIPANQVLETIKRLFPENIPLIEHSARVHLNCNLSTNQNIC